MPGNDSLRRLGGGRWETRDGRFAIEPQSGTWVIVDNEQTDELGLPLVRGPFGSLTAAKEAIEATRRQGPAASPLAGRLEQARRSEQAPPKASMPSASKTARGEPAAREEPAARPEPAVEPEPRAPEPGPKAPEPRPRAPEPPPEPRWLRDLEPADQRRGRDLIVRLARMGIEDRERVVRAEIADGQPALARLALERAIAKAVGSSKVPPGAVRAAVGALLRGADVELGVSWKLVDGDGRRIEKLDLPE